MLDLKDAKTACWTLRAASTDRTHLRIAEDHSHTHEAWKKMNGVVPLHSALRIRALRERMMEMKLRKKNNPSDMLTRLDDLADRVK